MAAHCYLAFTIIFLVLSRTSFFIDYNCPQIKGTIFGADIALFEVTWPSTPLLFKILHFRIQPLLQNFLKVPNFSFIVFSLMLNMSD